MKYRMVDRILAWQPLRTIRGIKTVSFEEYELREPQGDEPCLPESLVMEALFQLGNWLIVLSSDYTQMGLVLQWDEASFPDRLRPGRRLQMEINARSWREDGILFDGTAWDGEKTVAVGRRCLAVPVPLADYYDPDNLRVLFLGNPSAGGAGFAGGPDMPRLKEREETYFTTVRGMCRHCRAVGPSRVFFRNGQVWQQSLCPCSPQEPALVAADSRWYLAEVVRAMPDSSPLAGAKPPQQGCPHDCGPCAWHASPCQLPVLSITNACNLRCPICFTYNRHDQIYHISVEEMERTVEWIVASTGRVDLINVTGGEPTLHPKLLEILRVCRRPEIGRITMNSNGIRLAEDLDLCRQLAEMEVCVILSLNTLDPETSRQLHGRDLTAVKQQAIENLATAGVRMTLLNVLIRGVNENDLAGIWELMRRHDHILSLTVQTMTYTGQGGGSFPRSRHIPVDEAARILSLATGGEVDPSDFIGRPAAHPLCYLICYLLKSGERMLPFARFAPKEELRRLLTDSYLLRPAVAQDFFTDAINRLYAAGETEHLAVLRRLIEQLYPPGRPIDDFKRQRLAESAVRTIYLHAHMDEDTFDCSRAMLCPDLVPAEPGRMIPACTYNLFYRMKDPRFYVGGSTQGAEA